MNAILAAIVIGAVLVPPAGMRGTYYRLRNFLRRITCPPSCPQPVPTVSDADVERALRRNFKPHEFAAAIALLHRNASQTGSRNPSRIYLAALKLANGDIERLRDQAERATQDFRDVLAAAEYPTYFSILRVIDLPQKEQRRVIDEDWHQYDEWLRRDE